MFDNAGFADVRSTFRCAVDGFVAVVDAVPSTRLSEGALGSWNIRDLIGHASRALSTIESYGGRTIEGPLTAGPAGYFAQIGEAPPGSDARRRRDDMIAERGREAGAALGDNPAATVRTLAERVIDLVDTMGGDTPVASPAGQMTLAGYLPTRTFELVVHTLDLATALGLPVPEVLRPAIAMSTMLAGEIAAGLPSAPDVLLALCGRGGLPEAFSVV
ncbi:MAG: maleylpyruvate isomerase N-terminal domain-containing protein [Actinobacteria bacterium]|nr:maleylpyruvate isomerase N-terminal domain-containing protein [Actinomycetota bacterium]